MPFDSPSTLSRMTPFTTSSGLPARTSAMRMRKVPGGLALRDVRLLDLHAQGRSRVLLDDALVESELLRLPGHLRLQLADRPRDLGLLARAPDPHGVQLRQSRPQLAIGLLEPCRPSPRARLAAAQPPGGRSRHRIAPTRRRSKAAAPESNQHDDAMMTRRHGEYVRTTRLRPSNRRFHERAALSRRMRSPRR